jgi:mRNA-degrading endonuclease YafQ of YafQ-DinJ toxin-antitoxin module
LKTLWKVQYDEGQFELDLKALILKGEIESDDFEIIRKWINQVEKHGPHSLRKTKRIDDFHPMNLTNKILNRPEVFNNFWHDHDLYGKWNGYRSSAFSQMGRIIYKIENNELKIVKVEKLTATHNYKG